MVDGGAEKEEQGEGKKEGEWECELIATLRDTQKAYMQTRKAICRPGNKCVLLCSPKACKTHGDYKASSPWRKTLCKKEGPRNILSGVNGKAWQTLRGKEKYVSGGDADATWIEQQDYSATG